MATIPPLIDTALEELGTLGGTPFGLNVWLCDLQNETLERIYTTPESDDEFSGEPPAPDVINSRPVWSPDGDAIVWANLNSIEQTQSLMMFELEIGLLEEMPLDAPLPFAYFAPPELRWSAENIVFTQSLLNEETFLEEEFLYVVDPGDGTIISENLMAAGGEQNDFIVERLPLISPDGTTTLALRYFQAGWVLVDPQTGDQQPLDGLPELFSPLAPQGLSLLVDVDENYNYNWEVQGLEQPAPLDGYPRERIAISPDGDAVAYADSVLHILNEDGTVQDIAGSDSFADDFSAMILWGPTAWRVQGTTPIVDVEAQQETTEETEVDEEEAASPPVCEGSQPTRLSPETEARVISETVPMNVREEPSTGGNLIGQIPGGESFTVLESATCADGYTWVLISYGGLSGWVAEAGSEYFLEPSQP